MGVIAICGPIDTRFLYSLDDLVYGGANTMIEVMRQAFHDMATLLAKLPGGPLLMPRKIFLQFDNCGENKVRFDYYIKLSYYYSNLLFNLFVEQIYVWIP